VVFPQKMEHVFRLIKEGLSITDLCHELGFKGEQQFAYFFRLMTGNTLKKWMNTGKNES